MLDPNPTPLNRRRGPCTRRVGGRSKPRRSTQFPGRLADAGPAEIGAERWVGLLLGGADERGPYHRYGRRRHYAQRAGGRESGDRHTQCARVIRIGADDRASLGRQPCEVVDHRRRQLGVGPRDRLVHPPSGARAAYAQAFRVVCDVGEPLLLHFVERDLVACKPAQPGRTVKPGFAYCSIRSQPPLFSLRTCASGWSTRRLGISSATFCNRFTVNVWSNSIARPTPRIFRRLALQRSSRRSCLLWLRRCRITWLCLPGDSVESFAPGGSSCVLSPDRLRQSQARVAVAPCKRPA